MYLPPHAQYIHKLDKNELSQRYCCVVDYCVMSGVWHP